MYCKFCGEKIEDDSIFCGNCGAKLASEEGKSTIPTAPNDSKMNSLPEDEKPVKKSSGKALTVVQKIVSGCLIAGIVGAVLFFGIVVVGLIAYGRVYLFDGYAFTRVLTIISLILMITGICAIITKSILYFKFKIGTFPKTVLKRILLIVLALSCLIFSIVGFVDCSSNMQHNGNSGDGDSGNSYVSFVTIYLECNCEDPWADWGVDYLTVDTNPYDYDSDSYASTTYMSVALSAISSINIRLGLPSYLYDEMLETRGMDGRQTYSGTNVDVSWRYHPDAGLEVRYTAK